MRQRKHNARRIFAWSIIVFGSYGFEYDRSFRTDSKLAQEECSLGVIEMAEENEARQPYKCAVYGSEV